MAEARDTTLMPRTETGNRSRYKVTGMDCASCAQKIDAVVRRVAGVSDVSISVGSGTLSIAHEPTLILASVEQQVKGLGYGIVRVDEAGDHASERRAYFA